MFATQDNISSVTQPNTHEGMTMKFAINAYTGNWLLVETVALFGNEHDARAALADGMFARNRPGLTLVVEQMRW